MMDSVATGSTAEMRAPKRRLGWGVGGRSGAQEARGSGSRSLCRHPTNTHLSNGLAESTLIAPNLANAKVRPPMMKVLTSVPSTANMRMVLKLRKNCFFLSE